MVRLLKSPPHPGSSLADIPSPRIDLILAILYIPCAILYALGTLAHAQVVPYLTHLSWRLLLVSSFYLTFANLYDFFACTKGIFRTNPSRKQRHVGEALRYIEALAALSLTFGSVSLLNSGIIATLGPGDVDAVCRHQYAASCALFLLGASANNVHLIVVPVNGNNADIVPFLGGRVLLSFLNVAASAAFCVRAVLGLPSVAYGDTEVNGGDGGILGANLACFASFAIVVCALVHYFHVATIAFWTQEVLFDTRGYVEELSETDIEHGSRKDVMSTVKDMCESGRRRVFGDNQQEVESFVSYSSADENSDVGLGLISHEDASPPMERESDSRTRRWKRRKRRKSKKWRQVYDGGTT